MKCIVRLAAVMVSLLACSGLALGQGYDQLNTGAGTSDDLSSMGLGIVNFQGVPLSSNGNNYDTGTADTIVWRESPIPPSGGTINIQIVALYLVNTGTVTCTNPACSPGQQVTVYATINATNGIIPTTVLPVPDSEFISPSTGTMTVNTNNFTFNTNSTALQADIIVVPEGAPVTAAPIFHAPMSPDHISATGSVWTPTPPPGYPESPFFPSGGFYVALLGGSRARVGGMFFRMLRPFLYGLGIVLMGIAFLEFGSKVRRAQLGMSPAYLLGLAVLICLIAWRAPNYAFPTVAHAYGADTHGTARSVPPPGLSALEIGLLAQHGIFPAGTPVAGPTLPEWGVIVMALALIGFSIWRIRHSRLPGAA